RLALGYSMGAKKLQASLAEGMLGQKPVHLEFDECSKLVEMFRQRSPQIVGLWRAMDRVIAQMMLGQEGQYKCLSWGPGHILLPSGLKLHYKNLEREGMSNFSYQQRDSRSFIYGGLLVENLCQAIARCIISDAMLEVSKQYPVVMMVHDEIVAVAPD